MKIRFKSLGLFSFLVLSSLFLISCSSKQNSKKSEFLLDCIGDKNFTMLLKVNPIKKTVFFLSSGPLSNREQFKPNHFNNVVMWENKRIISYTNFESNTSTQTIFLEGNNLLNTGHYPNGEFYNEFFKCQRK